MILSAVKNLFFWRPYTTRQNIDYWKKRGDEKYWVDYQNTWKHPHRLAIAAYLKKLGWFSLFEIGCGSAPNLILIARVFPKRQMGGMDINPKAIEIAERVFKGALFKVGDGGDIFMSDKSTDVVLVDAYLIYVGPLQIRKYIRELKRIGRNYLVMHEFHHKSWLKRWKLRVFSGRHAYDYKKLLEQEGFYDIQVYRMPVYEADNEQEFRHFIVARIPS